jgi:hypothetical protein
MSWTIGLGFALARSGSHGGGRARHRQDSIAGLQNARANAGRADPAGVPPVHRLANRPQGPKNGGTRESPGSPITKGPQLRRLKSATGKRVLAATAASAVALLGSLLVSAAPAEAACQGVGGGFTITHYHGSIAVAQERQVTGTCDDNGYYSGELRDVHPDDGYSAKVRYKEEDFDSVVFTTTSSTWQRYTYVEKTPDAQTSYASMQVYTDPNRRPELYTPTYGF